MQREFVLVKRNSFLYILHFLLTCGLKTPLTLVCLLVQREFVLVKRNSFLYIFRFFLTMFMAVVTATLFLRTQLHPNSLSQGQLYFGVVFFSLIMLMFDGFAEMTFTILRLPGFYKQRGGPLLLSAVPAMHHANQETSCPLVKRLCRVCVLTDHIKCMYPCIVSRDCALCSDHNMYTSHLMLHVMVQANYTVIGYDTSSSDVVCWYACSLSAVALSIRACHLT